MTIYRHLYSKSNEMTEMIREDREGLISTFLDKNAQINLSAIRDAEGVREKHILDSLELTKLLDIEPGQTCLDLGTGGGFPLLPLAMSYPEVLFTGIDARKKKIAAVQAMIDSLGLKNIELIRGRIEEQKTTYDCVVTRAVAYADQLFDRARPRLKKGGLLCLYKMRTAEEDELILTLMRQRRGEPIALHEYRLPHDAEGLKRILYILRKE